MGQAALRNRARLCRVYVESRTVALQTSSLQYFFKYNRASVNMMRFPMALKRCDDFFFFPIQKPCESGSQCACNFKQRHNPFKEDEEEGGGGGKVNMRMSYKKQDLTLV